MTIRRTLPALALLLGLAACSPANEYTAAEAPKNLGVETSTTRIDMHFAAGSARLAAADAARLRSLAATGAIAPADRVLIAAAGSPELARQRVGAIAGELLHYGIVADAEKLPQVAANQAIVEIARSLVTLPPCPNWSKPATSDFTNSASSNFGCATAVNLGLMVANPLDLASARTLGPAAGQPAVAAVNRYLTDKVALPAANANLPIASATANAPAGGSGNNGGSQ